jgi:sodium/bile acid cotransporter 7
MLLRGSEIAVEQGTGTTDLILSDRNMRQAGLIEVAEVMKAGKKAKFRAPAADGFLIGLLCCAALGVILPVPATLAQAFSALITGAIVLLFFCNGLKLTTEAVVGGFGHWRLHLTILVLTFIMYPLAALTLHRLTGNNLSPNLWVGIFFLACVPSTVQSSIAFVSLANGNVPAAIAQASASNVLGVILTPLLAAWLVVGVTGGISISTIGNICLLLLLPFAAGHLLRPLLFRYAEPHLQRISMLDKLTILLVVYSAFSKATISHQWDSVSSKELFLLGVFCAVLLGIGLLISFMIGRLLGFNLRDRTTIFYAGTLKSLATGVPIAQLILPASQIGMAVLPLMIFHQLQLLLCGWLANRAAQNSEPLERAAHV